MENASTISQSNQLFLEFESVRAHRSAKNMFERGIVL